MIASFGMESDSAVWMADTLTLAPLLRPGIIPHVESCQGMIAGHLLHNFGTLLEAPAGKDAHYFFWSTLSSHDRGGDVSLGCQ